jgi:hypothetical protein
MKGDCEFLINHLMEGSDRPPSRGSHAGQTGLHQLSNSLLLLFLSSLAVK